MLLDVGYESRDWLLDLLHPHPENPAMTTRLPHWTPPLGLAGLIIGGNIWMALIYAHSLLALGMLPGSAGVGAAGSGLAALLSGWGPLGFWGAFFGLLG